MMGMGRVLGGVRGDSVKCPVRAYTCPVGGKCKAAGWLDDDGGEVCWFDSPKRHIILMNILTMCNQTLMRPNSPTVQLRAEAA